MRFGRSHCSLKLGPSHAAWVDLSRTWWGRSHRHQRQITLPPGLIRPSPVEANITDPAALQSHLRRLVGGKGTTSFGRRPIVLVLPDLCVRATPVVLEAIPRRASELETLLRWRLEREAFFPMNGTRLTWQVLDSRTVLTVLIRDAVIQQYEAVCEAVGLIPVEVDVATFRLCNLFANLVPSTGSIAWLTLLDDGFTLVIFQAGRPVLVRTKTRTYSDPAGLLQDVAHSLTLHEGQSRTAPHRLVVLSEEPGSELVQRLGTELGLEVIQPGGMEMKQTGWSDTTHEIGVLAAAAGLLGTA
jgi:Tfp pilus assembly PilM family ATPase